MVDAATYAVLTGDIVKSTKMDSDIFDDVRALVIDGVADASDWKRGLIRGKAEFFRGDSWQALVAHPAYALRIALFIRARLIAFNKTDSRIAIGLGSVDKISRSRISLSSGEAFRLSGGALDDMKRGRLTIMAGQSLRPSLGPLADWLPATASLCDAIVSEWTSRQAEIVGAALWPLHKTQETIASDMSITQQTVFGMLDAAHWNALSKALLAFESSDWSGAS